MNGQIFPKARIQAFGKLSFRNVGSRKTEMGEQTKVLFAYEDLDGNTQIESLWATSSPEGYQVDNIPFFASNIAYGDVVLVEEENGALYFHDLVSESGHSTIQMILFEPAQPEVVCGELVELSCSWESAFSPRQVSVDVPPSIAYATVKAHLDEGCRQGRWDYKEACLSRKHKTELPTNESTHIH